MSEHRKLKRITLEVSLKPFWDLRPEAIRAVCREIFRQWDALSRPFDEVAVMMWIADGSEILDYAGRMEDQFEWAKWIGIANPRGPAALDPDELGLHSKPHPYRDDAPDYTYGDLKTIVSMLHEVGREMTGKPIHVGATFDPGGEFAKSSFKYERHSEICMAHTMGYKSFVCCYATLNADTRAYAAYPNGIPQDTSLGSFLGKQAYAFSKDLGFDYLWLSNGFGFGMETWKSVGPLFDGKQFEASAAPEIRGKILQFWRDLRDGLKEIPVEVRGTNLGTGADLATDAVPLREIMEGGFGIRNVAPNSPWAAINGDFGVEMVGYMSRIAQVVPGQDFMFRYYVHDPWWLNSPWLDRYGRQPHDIVMPLSVGRIRSDGKVEAPDTLALLTIDDSFGRMPVECPNEITPHILRSMHTGPDAPGLVTWIYPFDLFHDFAIDDPKRLPEAFFHDWFIRSAINNGLPLNTVVSDRAVLEAMAAAPEIYQGTILMSRVPDAGSTSERAILQHVRAGGRALVFGPTDRASREMRELLSLKPAEPAQGEMELHRTAAVDHCVGDAPTRLIHRPLLCAGPMANATAEAPGVRALASVLAGGRRLAAAQVRQLSGAGGGQIAWVRGTLSSGYDDGGETLQVDDPKTYAQGDVLLRDAFAALGLHVGTQRQSASQRQPMLAISRHQGALWFAGFHPDTTVGLDLATSEGMPLFVGADVEVENGVARYRMPPAWRLECRVLVEQSAGTIRCREQHSGHFGITRRIFMHGLKDATVRFLPVPGTESAVTFQINPKPPFAYGPFLNPERVTGLCGSSLKVTGVTGSLIVSW